MLRRRDALALIASGVATPAFAEASATRRLRDLEAASGGRIGVCALDTGSGRRLAHRADERFPLCSTFKVLAAAAILHRVDTNRERLDRQIVYRRSDLQTYSPVTEKHLDAGMTLDAICAAAIGYSDNTAGNLMIAALGGPQDVTGYLRSIGDRVTRLDRREPELNRVGPHDVRDTTSPAALQETLRKLVLGATLSPASRDRLTGWMLDCRTGGARLRAGVPKDWRVADKTGTGPAGGGVNDVAVLWPPGRAPIVVAAYTVDSPKAPDARDAVLAEIGRIVAASL